MVQLTVFARQIHTNPSTFVLEVRIQVNARNASINTSPTVRVSPEDASVSFGSAGIVSSRDRRSLVARLAAFLIASAPYRTAWKVQENHSQVRTAASGGPPPQRELFIDGRRCRSAPRAGISEIGSTTHRRPQARLPSKTGRVCRGVARCRTCGTVVSPRSLQHPWPPDLPSPPLGRAATGRRGAAHPGKADVV